MRNENRFSLVSIAALAIAILIVTTMMGRADAQESVIYNFTGMADGKVPYGHLIFDSSGNLYGTANTGGAHYSGAVFELTPASGGGWTEQVLYSFADNGTDGYFPLAGLVFDSAGNLYGTTDEGGAYNYGTVFELRKTKTGWAERILHSFNNNGKDGVYPDSSLVVDAAGNLYGTTSQGGTYNGGTAFELSPVEGAWRERVLRSFNLNGVTATNSTSLVLDSSGNLYGTLQSGGARNFGMVFELSPSAEGAWTVKVLHNFDYNGTDGYAPQSGLIFDSSGNLYGSTNQGGTGSDGTVYELSPNASGVWTEKILADFSLQNGGPGYPVGNLTFDSAGNLYGTTFQGGTNNDGTVFELTPASGAWSETLLHSFGGGTDGTYPWAGVVIDSSGNIFGTTLEGGTDTYGTVFEILP